MATYGSGPQGGRALIAPSYAKNISRIQISTSINTPQKIPRVYGPHRIVMSSGANTWSFAITGGTNRVSSSVLPMFPKHRDDLYDQSINFRINGQDLPPAGCTITTVMPIPQNTTLINVFSVTETVTGSNLSFLLGYCPFMGVDSTVTYTGAPVAGLIDIKIISYRASAGNQRAFGYIQSFGAPTYVVRNFQTSFVPVLGVNPLDAFSPLNFERVSGQQTILVMNTTTKSYFAFDVDYGIISQGNGYLGYISPTANARLASMDIENATLLSITTPTASGAIPKVIQYLFLADDGRTYKFTFEPNGAREIPPTIELVSPGPGLGADTLVVNVFVRYFQTI